MRRRDFINGIAASRWRLRRHDAGNFLNLAEVRWRTGRQAERIQA
jgi:hypothetical protein